MVYIYFSKCLNNLKTYPKLYVLPWMIFVLFPISMYTLGFGPVDAIFFTITCTSFAFHVNSSKIMRIFCFVCEVVDTVPENWALDGIFLMTRVLNSGCFVFEVEKENSKGHFDPTLEMQNSSRVPLKCKKNWQLILSECKKIIMFHLKIMECGLMGIHKYHNKKSIALVPKIFNWPKTTKPIFSSWCKVRWACYARVAALRR